MIVGVHKILFLIEQKQNNQIRKKRQVDISIDVCKNKVSQLREVMYFDMIY